MQYAKTAQLFQLFSGCAHVCDYDDLILAAVSQVEKKLRDNADPEDSRLCFLAAAIANLQYRRILAAQTAEPSYAGMHTPRTVSGSGCTLAEQLAADYLAAAAPLLRDDSFLFGTVKHLRSAEYESR